MSFLSQFASYFSPAEKESELYKLWSQIGVNAEKAYLETQEKLNASMTDINTLDEDISRSWLSFFLKKIPYRITSKLGAVLQSPDDAKGSIIIPRNSTLRSKTGVQWVLPERVVIQSGAKRDVTLLQGKISNESGTYNSIIKIQAKSPDLEYITVKLNGKEVPPVSFDTSYSNLKYHGSWSPVNERRFDEYGNLILEKTYGGTPFLNNAKMRFTAGDMYNVTAKGTTSFEENGEKYTFYVGDIVVYDGKKWGPISSATGLNPFQFQNQYVAPNGGYYAYFYGGFLYIKIYPGTVAVWNENNDATDEVIEIDEPTGLTYEIEYLESDGKQGEIPLEEAVEFDSTFVDADNNIVSVSVSHDSASTAAVNEPSKGKMNLMIKERLYSGISVSSVPEYTAWFKGQPEIGDCLVLSDLESWIRGGMIGYFETTGEIKVYAVDRAGNPLSNETKDTLAKRLKPYQDIAYVRFVEDLDFCFNYFKVEFFESVDNSAFKTYVRDCIQQWYNVDFLQERGSSLFSNLNLSEVLNNIINNDTTSTTGIVISAYHVISQNLGSGGTNPSFQGWAGEAPGKGFYKIVDAEGNELDEFFERENFTPNSATIYDRLGNVIGSNNNGDINLDLGRWKQEHEEHFNEYILKAYLAMANEGVLTVGKENGIRAFEDVGFESPYEM